MRRGPGRRRVRAIALLLMVAFVAAACGGDDSGSNAQASGGSDAAQPGGESRDPVEAADRSGELRFAYTTGVNSFDPQRTPAPQGDPLFMRPVYDRLLTVAKRDGVVELAPQLATSYEVAEDGMSVEFELRDDVTFQDGTHFDADAVKANIERALGPGSTVASVLASIAGVEVVDPTHVVFHLEAPDPSIPWAMATATTGMMVSPAALNNPDLATKPVGSGPFKLVSAVKDADVVYERWDDYWDPDAALVAKLTISTVSDGNVRYNGIQAGEFDAAYMSTPQDTLSKSLTAEGFHWEQVLSPVSYGVLINSAKPPFDDVRVRRAVSMALNREEISEALLNGLNPPVYQPFATGFLGHDDGLDDDPYDLDAAKDLVDEAGADGATIQMIQPLTEPQQSLSTVVQQALGDIGLNVELVPLSPTEGRPAWRTGAYHAMTAPINARPDPSSTLRTSYLADDNPAPPPPELVDMADDAAALPVDSAEREEAYQEISAYLVENTIHVPVAQFSTVILAGPDIVGSENLMVTGISDVEFRRVGIATS